METYAAQSVTLDHHRWYSVITIKLQDESTITRILSSGEGDGTLIFDSIEEMEAYWG